MFEVGGGVGVDGLCWMPLASAAGANVPHMPSPGRCCGKVLGVEVEGSAGGDLLNAADGFASVSVELSLPFPFFISPI